ncbi:MAG: contractile injection system tape measure protein [Cyanobacteria bacterium J06621_11]
MLQQRHAIKTQILDLQVPADLSVLELQNQISTLYHHHIVPLIQAHCDQLSEDGQLYRLDTLEIDLGEIALETLEIDFVKQATEYLPKQLAEIITATLSTHSQSTEESTVSLTSESATIGENNTAALRSNTYLSTEELNGDRTSHSHLHNNPQLECFTHFLETGRLPWWSESISTSALEECTQHLRHQFPTQIKALLQAHIKHPTRIDRLVYHFSDRTQQDLICLLKPSWSDWLTDYAKDAPILLRSLKSQKTISDQHRRNLFWRGLWCQLPLIAKASPHAKTVIYSHLVYLFTSLGIALEGDRTPLSQLHHTLSQRAENTLSLPTQQALKSINQSAVTAPSTANTSDTQSSLKTTFQQLTALLSTTQSAHSSSPNIIQLQSRLTALIDNSKHPAWSAITHKTFSVQIEVLVAKLMDFLRWRSLSIGESPTPQSITQPIEQLLQTLQSPTKESVLPRPSAADCVSPTPALPTPPLHNTTTPSFSHSEDIYIQNAGLIILWPFLPRFFEKLTLIKNNQFLNEQTTQRAICLLQWIATENLDMPEHLLSLNKLLCAHPMPAPVEPMLEITETEKTECETLLRAVIQNWTALKNTTLPGFRKAFLQRKGRLTPADGLQRLQVEHESYDILLDQAPWNIQVVKLPWMPELLHVEW